MKRLGNVTCFERVERVKKTDLRFIKRFSSVKRMIRVKRAKKVRRANRV